MSYNLEYSAELPDVLKWLLESPGRICDSLTPQGRHIVNAWVSQWFYKAIVDSDPMADLQEIIAAESLFLSPSQPYNISLSLGSVGFSKFSCVLLTEVSDYHCTTKSLLNVREDISRHTDPANIAKAIRSLYEVLKGKDQKDQNRIFSLSEAMVCVCVAVSVSLPYSLFVVDNKHTFGFAVVHTDNGSIAVNLYCEGTRFAVINLSELARSVILQHVKLIEFKPSGAPN